MRIAWFTAVEGATLGSVRVVTELIKAAGDTIESELFLDESGLQAIKEGSAGVPEVLRELPSWHYLYAFKRDEQKPFDLYVFLLEDNSKLLFVRHSMLMFPGVCIALDQYFPRLESLAPWNFVIADTALNNGYEEESSTDRPKCADSVIDDFHGIFLTNSEHGATVLRSAYAREQVHILPLPLSSSAIEMSIALSIQRDKNYEDFLIATFGTEVIEERLGNLLDAVIKLNSSGKLVRLDWIVTNETDRNAVAATLKARKERERDEVKVIIDTQISISNVRSENELLAVLCSCDLFALMNFDPLHNSFPLIEMALGCGIPTILLRTGRVRELPRAAYFGIEPGVGEFKELYFTLEKLTTNKSALASVGNLGREAIVELSSPSAVYADFNAVVSTHLPSLTRLLRASRSAYHREVNALDAVRSHPRYEVIQ